MEAYLKILFTIFNIIKYLIYILIASAIVIFIFLKVSPAFGGIPDDEAQKTIEDSQNFIVGSGFNGFLSLGGENQSLKVAFFSEERKLV